MVYVHVNKGRMVFDVDIIEQCMTTMQLLCLCMYACVY